MERTEVKGLFYSFCSFLIILIFSACSFRIPHKVTVVTDAEYNFCIGDVDKSFDDDLKISDIFKNLSNSGAITVDDYFPEKRDSRTQQFLIRVPFTEIDVTIPDFPNISAVPDDFDWDQIIGAYFTTPSSGIISIGFNPSTLFQNLSDIIGTTDVSIASLPFYVMAEKPDAGNSPAARLFDGAGFEGTITLFHGVDNGSSITKSTDVSELIIFDSSLPPPAGGKLRLVSAPSLKKDSGTVITDMDSIDRSASVNLATIINSAKNKTSGEFFMEYSLIFKPQSITKDMLVGNHTPGKIKVYAYLVIPLKFKVETTNPKGIEIDIFDMFGAGSGTDILGRNGPTDLGKTDKYISTIQRCSLIYEQKQLPFYANPDLELRLDLFNNGNEELYRSQSSVVTITSRQMRDIFNTYPFTPVAKIALPKDAVFSIPRQLKLKMNLSLQIKTNGEIDIFERN